MQDKLYGASPPYERFFIANINALRKASLLEVKCTF